MEDEGQIRWCRKKRKWKILPKAVERLRKTWIWMRRFWTSDDLQRTFVFLLSFINTEQGEGKNHAEILTHVIAYKKKSLTPCNYLQLWTGKDSHGKGDWRSISNHKPQSPVITIQPLNKKSSQFASHNRNYIVFAPGSLGPQLWDHSCRTPGYNCDSWWRQRESPPEKDKYCSIKITNQIYSNSRR